MQDLSHAVGVAERDVSDQQKGNAVLPLRVRVPMGAAGEGGPAAPRHPPAWVRAVGSEAAAAAPVLCLADYCIIPLGFQCFPGGSRNNSWPAWKIMAILAS